MWLLVDLLLLGIVVLNGFAVYFYVSRRSEELRQRAGVKAAMPRSWLADPDSFWARMFSVLTLLVFLGVTLLVMLQVVRLGVEPATVFLKICSFFAFVEEFCGVIPFTFGWKNAPQ